jgi:chitosanase
VSYASQRFKNETALDKTMKYSVNEKIKAAAIVNIFETGSVSGEFGAVGILDDGAGISYGIGQFTHRSGALRAVVEKYLVKGGPIARPVFEKYLPALSSRRKKDLAALATSDEFISALKKAARTVEMHNAQAEVAFESYMRPAILECERLGFSTPLALAVLYDSLVHGRRG